MVRDLIRAEEFDDNTFVMDDIYMDVYVRFVVDDDKQKVLSSSLRVDMSPATKALKNDL